MLRVSTFGMAARSDDVKAHIKFAETADGQNTNAISYSNGCGRCYGLIGHIHRMFSIEMNMTNIQQNSGNLANHCYRIFLAREKREMEKLQRHLESEVHLLTNRLNRNVHNLSF